ncbi:MAG TPA: glycosyltransferase family 2 protein [Puia sp.]|jgi:biofilm PGA synthesis N-glycosyltransferase PgaC|nr:glycosyltransferase family 2 protein [Puia sp.]
MLIRNLCEAVFFASCGIVLYNYAGYAFLAMLLPPYGKKKRRAAEAGGPLPSVSFIVAAFNEEDLIAKKILNSVGQQYPGGEIEFIFVTDGSSDSTPSIVAGYPSVLLLHAAQRKGKAAAMNRAVGAAKGEVLIFSDANTMLNPEAVMTIARHYADPAVGGVAGEKKVIGGDAGAPGEGEGLYWQYESLLKKIDSRCYSVVGAAGELFSLRKGLYTVLPENTVLDDFVLSLRVAQRGFRVLYEPGAYAMELPSFSYREEQKRKVRIAAGGFQSIVMLKGLFLFWRHPRLSFLYISHRVLRWTLSPLCLILAFLSNFVLCFVEDGAVFPVLFALQVAFYGMALLGGRGKTGNKLFKIPYYFAFMNVSVVLGFFRFLGGRQTALWEKAKRAGAGIAAE